MGWFSSSSTQEATAAPAVPASPAAASEALQLPPDHPPVPAGATCPVDESARATWLTVSGAEAGTTAASHPLTASSVSQTEGSNATAAQAEGESTATQAEGPTKARLSTAREISSIPRAASATYAHPEERAAQPVPGEETGNWVYPSEQQFFNAMMRKHHNPRAADMRTIVPIHNAVNERAWEEVLMWEAGRGGDRCGGVRLTSFVGRPKERSPKAWVKTVFGYSAPFDRHDWIVDRCGKQIRYVIDFYTGKPNPANPHAPTFYLDVRPALDDWEHVKLRMARLFQ